MGKKETQWTSVYNLSQIPEKIKEAIVEEILEFRVNSILEEIEEKKSENFEMKRLTEMEKICNGRKS